MRKRSRKRLRVYIDTNVYDYVALMHPVYGPPSKKLLGDVMNGAIEAYGSRFVAYEIYGSLSELNPQLAADAVGAYYSMPLVRLTSDVETYRVAATTSSLSGVSYDAVHAALMIQAGVNAIATEDLEDWTKIEGAWEEAARKHGYTIMELTILRPSKYST